MAATRKKKPAAKKPPARKKPVATKKAPARKPAKKPAPKKAKPVSTRRPPMHGRVAHPELGDADQEEVFETFKAFDRDGSGSIDRGELARLLEALGQRLDEEELDIALSVVDANGSGRVSWDEFRAWWTDR